MEMTLNKIFKECKFQFLLANVRSKLQKQLAQLIRISTTDTEVFTEKA